MKKIITTTVFLVLLITSSMAQNLDLTFGTGGKVITAFADTAYGQSLALQQDGKIIVAGDAITNGVRAFALARYNVDGTLDGSFGTGGKVTTPYNNNVIGNVAVQLDGKILICGTTEDSLIDSTYMSYHIRFTMFRYNTDGTLDASFGTNGMVRPAFSSGSFDNAYSLVIQPDQKFIVAGASGRDFAFMRFHPDGSIDSTFSDDGKFKVNFGYEDMAYTIALQQDGKFVAAGFSGNFPNFDFALTRCNANGTIDSTFGTYGLAHLDFGATYDRVYSLIIQADGKYVVAGVAGQKFAIARFTTSGQLDNTFNTDGLDTTFQSGGKCYAACIQSDGKILMTGAANNNFILLRYNTDGTIDNTFGTNGIDTTDFGNTFDQANASIMQQDGKILLAGQAQSNSFSRFAVARYHSVLVSVPQIEDISNNLNIYPNPFTEQAFIEYFLENSETINISIFDMAGKMVQKIISDEKRSNGKQIENLNSLKSLPAGNYILQLTTEKQKNSIKFQKL